MKKIYTIFTFIIAACLIGSHSVEAQTQVNVVKNDSLVIELDGYKQGTISWQRSANGTSWSTVSAYKDKTELAYKMTTTPYYFRSVIADGTCDPVYSDTIQANIAETFTVNAGHGYIESAPFVSSNGIVMKENGTLSSWYDYQESKAVWFFYQKPGTYKVSFNLHGSNTKPYGFEMKTSPAYDGLNYTPESFSFQYTGKGSFETVEFFTITIPTTGYYRYELNAKSTMNMLVINTLSFDIVRGPGSVSPDTHATRYLSSPSVHLGFSSTASTTKKYDWIYEEILVPEGFDPVASYYMSLGFYAGYMGIQTNSASERRVLFSAWDIVDKDKWPDAPKEALVSLVDKAEYTYANSFGNEGTGGQSYVGVGDVTTWKTGKPVKFLMNSRRDGGIIADKTISGVVNKGDSIKHSIVSAWYDAGEGWRYIASWRTPRKPNELNMFDGFYSFLENYGWTNGQIPRKAYYYNAYAKELTTEKWVHLNKVSFSNTDGATGQRIDYEQGVSDEDPTKFYMLSGGYGKTKKTGNTVPYVDIADFPSLNGLDLTPFAARVTQALEREAYLANIQFFDKTNWSVVKYSSQETSGEGSVNGRAARIIDGNDDTYWHSAWQSGTSRFPHWFVIDMAEAKTIQGFKFLSSGGESRYPRDMVIEVGNDSDPDGTWTEVWSGQVPLSPNLVELKNSVSGNRYIKLTIKDGYTNDAHTRLNEIYVF